jgi:hypothetical protein
LIKRKSKKIRSEISEKLGSEEVFEIILWGYLYVFGILKSCFNIRGGCCKLQGVRYKLQRFKFRRFIFVCYNSVNFSFILACLRV